MPSRVTSYTGLFSPDGPDPLTSVEIPLIQRDFAQGRTDSRVTEIRDRFLDVLYDAVAGDTNVGLDFVYGDLGAGTLRPLDGQQRLTTLFLLHWYLGFRAGQLGEQQPWMSFSYATRPSARLFCQRLTMAAPPPDVTDPAGWIVDQAWYLYVWEHDPTIQAMLVMIDAIDKRFRNCDPHVAWDRLVSPEDPAISFQLLPIDEMGSGEDLYIKMNSRGKPLTAFENFKARFERAISWAGDKATTFDYRVDGPWSDVMWRFRGLDDIVDDEFLRYFAFITDVCEWRLGRVPSGESFESRALALFGTEGPDAEASLSFLFHAFDTWVDVDVAEEFQQLFTFRRPEDSVDQPLLLFGTDGNVNLFDACCRHYDNRVRFSYGRTLLLLSVLLNRENPSPEFPQRLRVVRNLIEASESEFRPHRLPALVADVQSIIVDGSLDDITGFNRAQAEDEQTKRAFLVQHPELAPALFRLEDHYLLRGSLQAFELDESSFEHRAGAFESLMAETKRWRDVSGALLAAGEYARRRNPRNPRDLQFGSPLNAEPWRDLLTGTARSNLTDTARALSAVLDAAAAGTDEDTALRELRDDFLAARAQDKNFDWRYYLVRYEAMRDGPSGIYASVDGAMAYSICMLNRTQMNGRYRDPYLTALVREAGATADVDDGETGPFFIGGYVEDDRWMHLRKSRTALRNAPDGFVLRPPAEPGFVETFERVCADLDLDDDLKLHIPQQPRDDGSVDSDDRVQVGAHLLRALVSAGL